MKLPGLTESTLQARTTEESYQRGEAYFNAGAVRSLERSGARQVEALVKGSSPLPYTVHVRHDDAGITGATCTCPYFAGSWCKHIVATLLACLHASGPRQERPSVAALLEGLDRAALVALIERLLEHHPHLAGWIEHEGARLR